MWVVGWRWWHLAACALVAIGVGGGEGAFTSADCFTTDVFGADLAPGCKAPTTMIAARAFVLIWVGMYGSHVNPDGGAFFASGWVGAGCCEPRVMGMVGDVRVGCLPKRWQAGICMCGRLLGCGFCVGIFVIWFWRRRGCGVGWFIRRVGSGICFGVEVVSKEVGLV